MIELLLACSHQLDERETPRTLWDITGLRFLRTAGLVSLEVVRPSNLIAFPCSPAKRFTQTDMTTQIKQSRGRSILAAASGNVLEWYDFTVYGFMASTIAVLFFPSEDKVASLLSAFAVLAVGYAARPVGSPAVWAYR
ncbi:hypothetical protein [Roseibium alexandrii]|uniref:hypothetical protein n=1 Tax=Roseibium alexandrii TaxID=388408 RepID=UPI00399214F4